MVSKPKLAQKIFQIEGHMQGSKRVPMKPVREYGTGMPSKSTSKTKKKK